MKNKKVFRCFECGKRSAIISFYQQNLCGDCLVDQIEKFFIHRDAVVEKLDELIARYNYYPFEDLKKLKESIKPKGD